MSLPEVASRDQWLSARKRLLAREKELTRQRDALNADRRRLPMVRIDKDYRFEGGEGTVSLPDLFAGSSQLIVRHTMFDPASDQACPGCSAVMAETGPGVFANLKTRDTTYVVVSRAPYPKIAAYRAQRGWSLPWYSSFGTDFNYDFGVTQDAAVAPVQYNYRNHAELIALDSGWADEGSAETPGYSCFMRDGDAIFHTYSTYGRGVEQPDGGTYMLLDLTALGRQEDWEEPKGRASKVHGGEPGFG